MSMLKHYNMELLVFLRHKHHGQQVSSPVAWTLQHITMPKVDAVDPTACDTPHDEIHVTICLALIGTRDDLALMR